MRDRRVVLAVLVLALVVGVPLLWSNNQRLPPLTVYSVEPGGGKALRLWLEQLGHPVTTIEGGRYAVSRDVSVVLLLAPMQPISDQAIGELERWTRQGGRLVVATDSILTRELLRAFGVSTRITDQITQVVPADAGLLDPAIDRLSVETRFALDLDEREAEGVPLLIGVRGEVTPPPPPSPARGGGRGRGFDASSPVVAARVPVDRGELIVLTAPALLSNAGLRTEANARLALSLIGPDRRARIAIDELHHGFGTLVERSFFDLLLEQAWGRAFFLAGGIVLLFLLWRGRRFGWAVPVFVDRGRSLGELVTSQAGLYRAGGKRAFVADHLARQLRHDLAQVVGLPSDASDAEIERHARTIGRDPTRALQALAGTRAARTDRQLLAITREGERAKAELAGTPPPAAARREYRLRRHHPLRGEGRRSPAPPLRAGEGVGG